MSVNGYRFTEGDREEALSIIREAAQWLMDSGMPLWPLDILNSASLGYSPGQYIVLYDGEGNSVAALILCYEDRLFWPNLPAGASGYIHKLAVRRRYAGQKMARRIIEHAVSICRAKGISGIRLDCEARRGALCAFYENLGFRRCEVRTMDVPGLGNREMALYCREL